MLQLKIWKHLAYIADGPMSRKEHKPFMAFHLDDNPPRLRNEAKLRDGSRINPSGLAKNVKSWTFNPERVRSGKQIYRTKDSVGSGDTTYFSAFVVRKRNSSPDDNRPTPIYYLHFNPGVCRRSACRLSSGQTHRHTHPSDHRAEDGSSPSDHTKQA